MFWCSLTSSGYPQSNKRPQNLAVAFLGLVCVVPVPVWIFSSTPSSSQPQNTQCRVDWGFYISHRRASTWLFVPSDGIFSEYIPSWYRHPYGELMEEQSLLVIINWSVWRRGTVTDLIITGGDQVCWALHTSVASCTFKFGLVLYIYDLNILEILPTATVKIMCLVNDYPVWFKNKIKMLL